MLRFSLKLRPTHPRLMRTTSTTDQVVFDELHSSQSHFVPTTLNLFQFIYERLYRSNDGQWAVPAHQKSAHAGSWAGWWVVLCRAHFFSIKARQWVVPKKSQLTFFFVHMSSVPKKAYVSGMLYSSSRA